jgi:glutamine amidotransferase
MIAIIDYGIGNLRSVEKALQHVGGNARLTSDPAIVRAARGVVLPGVGAFGACAAGLRAAGFEPLVLEVIQAGTPLLGICVGMQLLFDRSEEMGQHRGLGLLPGQVLRFPEEPDADAGLGPRLKVPQIGWNQLWHDGSDPLLAGVDPGSYAYFVHSYYCQPDDPGHVVATTDYGFEYASIVRSSGGTVWGVQFHPEKSHRVGLRLLRNFVALVQDR